MGPAGFGPQAQSGEARGQCKGPILGSMHDPALHVRVAAVAVCTTTVLFTVITLLFLDFQVRSSTLTIG